MIDNCKTTQEVTNIPTVLIQDLPKKTVENALHSTYSNSIGCFTVPGVGETTAISVGNGSDFTEGQWIQHLLGRFKIISIVGNTLEVRNSLDNTELVPGNAMPGTTDCSGLPIWVTSNPRPINVDSLKETIALLDEFCIPNLKPPKAEETQFCFIGLTKTECIPTCTDPDPNPLCARLLTDISAQFIDFSDFAPCFPATPVLDDGDFIITDPNGCYGSFTIGEGEAITKCGGSLKRVPMGDILDILDDEILIFDRGDLTIDEPPVVFDADLIAAGATIPPGVKKAIFRGWGDVNLFYTSGSSVNGRVQCYMGVAPILNTLELDTQVDSGFTFNEANSSYYQLVNCDATGLVPCEVTKLTAGGNGFTGWRWTCVLVGFVIDPCLIP